MKTKTINLYTFDELSESAKEKARDWYREGALDYEWWEFVYEDAETIGKILGIEIDHKTPNTPTIYFSGFWSQGDGACYEGSYSYAKGAPKAIRAYAGRDKELHRIADRLQELQRKHFYRLTADVKASGRYSHSGTMHAYIEDSRTGDCPDTDAEDTLTELLRDFADWIYKQLEKEYEWLMSDEQVDESIRANEYEFTEEGERA